MNYLLVLAATVLLAFDFTLSKRYQSIEGANLNAGLKFNAFIGIFTAIVFLIIAGFKVQFSIFSFILSFALALCGMTYSVLGFKIMEKGNVAAYSVFLMSGGMLLPYVFGIIFLNEAVNIWRILGIILMLFAILIYEKGNLYKRQSRIWLCIAVFVLNGLVSIISKSHQITPLNTVDSVIFVMYSGVAKFVISSVMLLVVGKKATSFAFNFKSSGYIIALSAIVGGVSYLLQLIGAKGLPASVLYPLVTGGNIIFSSIAGRVFFKDKLTLHQIISVLLCFTGTFLFL